MADEKKFNSAPPHSMLMIQAGKKSRCGRVREGPSRLLISNDCPKYPLFSLVAAYRAKTGTQQRIVNLDVCVVIDETKLAKTCS